VNRQFQAKTPKSIDHIIWLSPNFQHLTTLQIPIHTQSFIQIPSGFFYCHHVRRCAPAGSAISFFVSCRHLQ